MPLVLQKRGYQHPVSCVSFMGSSYLNLKIYDEL